MSHIDADNYLMPWMPININKKLAWIRNIDVARFEFGRDSLASFEKFLSQERRLNSDPDEPPDKPEHSDNWRWRRP